MGRAVVNNEINNLLLAKAGLDSKMREGEVVSALALIAEIMALPQPRILEAHVLRHPPVENLLGDASLRVHR